MKISRVLFASLSTAVLSSSAFAGAHTWRVNEVFSNTSGTVQFVELRCSSGSGENFTGGLKVTSASTGLFVTLNNTVGSTLNKTILLGTTAFAALPGAPAPDYIIPANFFNRNGDTISYHVYDSMTFGAGVVPTNCTDSLNTGGVIALNSPKNFADATAAINCTPPPPPCPTDTNGDHTTNVTDLLAVINGWGRCPAPPTPCPGDVNASNSVNVADLLAVIGAWGPCP